ncbi:MAG: 6-carboxytetrahydropterin synthase QueD [Candidatus Edwardsbacteria bacterium]|jgi:6-pyruvoyltetrahydropterin/6-carboxytetrahydropterin synthase|nr:6-carboxytetrahydropterin synthase QueD [Candidatus Edwardsbacteria bacterium]
MYYATVVRSFSAAHHLRDYQGKCERLHGHNYKVELQVKSPIVDRSGMVTDFTVLRQALDRLLQRFDHQDLNEIKPFDTLNPTAENIAKLIYEEMALKFSSRKVKIGSVTVWETESSFATYAAH